MAANGTARLIQAACLMFDSGLENSRMCPSSSLRLWSRAKIPESYLRIFASRPEQTANVLRPLVYCCMCGIGTATLTLNASLPGAPDLDPLAVDESWVSDQYHKQGYCQSGFSAAFSSVSHLTSHDVSSPSPLGLQHLHSPHCSL
jgi:hypothetical protein